MVRKYLIQITPQITHYDSHHTTRAKANNINALRPKKFFYFPIEGKGGLILLAASEGYMLWNIVTIGCQYHNIVIPTPPYTLKGSLIYTLPTVVSKHRRRGVFITKVGGYHTPWWRRVVHLQ